MPTKGSRGPWLWPLALATVGVILLLNNFLLLEGFNVTALWPLLLVIAGAQMLLRGDFVPSDDARTFGITRGSVESATVEVSAGEIDVSIRALQREGRLIAGQYAAGARPAMSVGDTHTHLKMDRASTPWLSFADWEMALARDLPWQILISTHLGQANLDLAGLILENAVVATGIGDIRLTAPAEALGTLYLRSALGSIYVTTPHGSRARIAINGGRMLGIHADENRYESQEKNVFLVRDADDAAPLVEIDITGTFGDVYLA
jgi:hypothetical protein